MAFSDSCAEHRSHCCSHRASSVAGISQREVSLQADSPESQLRQTVRSLLTGDAHAQCAVYGNFSGPKAQEIIVSRGKVLELLRPDDTGRLQTILSTEVCDCGLQQSLKDSNLQRPSCCALCQQNFCQAVQAHPKNWKVSSHKIWKQVGALIMQWLCRCLAQSARLHLSD